MKKVHTGILLLFLFVFGNACGQAWKEYADSAVIYINQKAPLKAIERYERARDILKDDSIGTQSYNIVSTKLAVLYRDNRDLEKAESILVEIRAMMEKKGKTTHLDYAMTGYELGRVYHRMVQYDKAIQYYMESLRQFEKLYGKVYALYATCCLSIGNVYSTLGKLDSALLYYGETKDIQEKLNGKVHMEVARACNSLGNIYRKKGHYEKSEQLFEESRIITEKLLGKDHLDYAICVNNYANLYADMGQFDKAVVFYDEAKVIWGNKLGKDHPNYAAVSDNLAHLYMDMGRYKNAESLLIEARAVRAVSIGTKHPDYAQVTSHLANFYYEMGDYEKAEALYQETIRVFEEAVGTENQYYALAIKDLGDLNIVMGQYKKAEELYQSSRLIAEKTVGKLHSIYAQVSNRLGCLYSITAQMEKAEPFFIEARMIYEKQLGKEHPDYGGACALLGEFYAANQQFPRAEELFQEAMNVWEKKVGKNNPIHASTARDLAELYTTKGQYEKAEPILNDVKEIMKGAFSDKHPEFGLTCKSLGRLFWNLKNYEKANSNFWEAFQVQNLLMEKMFKFTSEREKQTYLQRTSDLRNYILSLKKQNFLNDDRGLTYDVTLFYRNLILFSMQQLRNTIWTLGDATAITRYEEWINIKEQLAFWATKSTDEVPAYALKLDEKADLIEKELSRITSGLNTGSKKVISWKDLVGALGEDEAAIEFSEFSFYNGREYEDSTYYLAMVVRKGITTPTIISLFEKRQLESILRKGGTSGNKHSLNLLYSGRRKSSDLYDNIWKPLESELKGVKTVYYSPGGLLFKISFSAIPFGSETLSDRFKLVQLNTTASIAANPTFEVVDSSDKILMYGGVQYEIDSVTMLAGTTNVAGNPNATRSFSGNPIGSQLPEFKFLTGTGKEVGGISKLAFHTGHKVELAEGKQATEESFKKLSGGKSPEILHIATHGFFFPDPRHNNKSESMGGIGIFRQSDNPLIRSGLALAGANNAWKGKPVPGVEDGILTAYEVSNMYLPNTKLAVLSACETGLGDIQGSEGVYGLQRAFKMAGVENLVMSLWKVPDAETAEFMQQFYKNLFAKETIQDAFYNAQKIMRNKYRNDPYKWAAWVLIR